MPRANRYFFDRCSQHDSTSSIHGVVPGYVWHIVDLALSSLHNPASLESPGLHFPVQPVRRPLFYCAFYSPNL